MGKSRHKRLNGAEENKLGKLVQPSVVPFKKKAEPNPGLLLSGGKELKLSCTKTPRVVFSIALYEQLQGYIQSETNAEITLLGSITVSGSDYTVSSLILPTQRGNAVNTDVNLESLTDVTEPIKLWIHTHPGMEAFWSTLDDETATTLGSDYLISIVCGKDNQMLCRMDIINPFRHTIDDIPVVVTGWVMRESVLEACALELSEKLEHVPVMATSYAVGSWKGHTRATRHYRSYGRATPLLSQVEIAALSAEQDASETEYCQDCGFHHSLENACPDSAHPDAFSEEKWAELMEETTK